MIPIARLANPAMIIAIAKFLMFFMPCHLLFLLLDLVYLRTTQRILNTLMSIQSQEGIFSVWIIRNPSLLDGYTDPEHTKDKQAQDRSYDIADKVCKLGESCGEINLGEFDGQAESEAHKKGCCIYEISPALC